MERRNTIQRDIVLKAVRSLGNHASADEIYACVSKDFPSIGKGTVYRNLNILAEEGEIRKVEIPEGPDRFDHNVGKHYHVTCIKCRKVFDADMDVLTDLNEKIHSKNGMIFLDHDIVFKGLCPNCQEK